MSMGFYLVFLILCWLSHLTGVFVLLLSSSAYPIYKEPYNFSPQVGSFEVLDSGDPVHKHVMTQVVIEDPIYWCLFINLVWPIGVLGDASW